MARRGPRARIKRWFDRNTRATFRRASPEFRRVRSKASFEADLVRLDAVSSGRLAFRKLVKSLQLFTAACTSAFPVAECVVASSAFSSTSSRWPFSRVVLLSSWTVVVGCPRVARPCCGRVTRRRWPDRLDRGETFVTRVRILIIGTCGRDYY